MPRHGDLDRQDGADKLYKKSRQHRYILYKKREYAASSPVCQGFIRDEKAPWSLVTEQRGKVGRAVIFVKMTIGVGT